MVSTVRLFSRRVRWRGGTLWLGGIGNVATDPAHRGRGHAGRLMCQALEVMGERGFEISLLFTDIPQYYARFDYAVFEQPWWTVDPGCLRTVAADEAVVRDVDLTEDAPGLGERGQQPCQERLLQAVGAATDRLVPPLVACRDLLVQERIPTHPGAPAETGHVPRRMGRPRGVRLQAGACLHRQS